MEAFQVGQHSNDELGAVGFVDPHDPGRRKRVVLAQPIREVLEHDPDRLDIDGHISGHVGERTDQGVLRDVVHQPLRHVLPG